MLLHSKQQSVFAPASTDFLPVQNTATPSDCLYYVFQLPRGLSSRVGA